MTLQSDVSRGWTIVDAFERVASPSQWDDWIAARDEYVAASTPIPSGPGSFIHQLPQKITDLKVVAQAALSAVKSNLWKLLEDDHLVATGSREGPSAHPTIIHPLAWRSLTLPKMESPIVRERFGTKTKIYNVRIFPVLHAPDASSRLKGLSLADAFRKFILEDPEVVALGKRVMRDEGYEEVFRDGQAPGPTVDFHWPLGASADDLAASICLPASYGPEAPLPMPSSRVITAAKALADRWSALRRSLVRGDIEASGTFTRTGVPMEISKTQWARDGLLVHVRNSDLCEVDKGKPVPRWTGITLGISFGSSDNVAVIGLTPRSPEIGQTARKLEGTRRRSAPRESIDAAVRAIWPNGVPKGIMAGKRNQQITDWQRANGLAVPHDKTIDRYFGEAKNRS